MQTVLFVFVLFYSRMYKGAFEPKKVWKRIVSFIFMFVYAMSSKKIILVHQMLFSTQLVKPDTPALNLNGTVITLCDKVRYLGITVDDKLRYQEHVQSVLTTVSQRMYIVKNFVYLSSKPLSNMLFKSFIVSLISYCLPILYTSIHASDKKCIRKVFKDAIKLGIEHPGIDHLQWDAFTTRTTLLMTFSINAHQGDIAP